MGDIYPAKLYLRCQKKYEMAFFHVPDKFFWFFSFTRFFAHLHVFYGHLQVFRGHLHCSYVFYPVNLAPYIYIYLHIFTVNLQ